MSLLVIRVAVRLLVIPRRGPYLIANEVMPAGDFEPIPEATSKLKKLDQYVSNDVSSFYQLMKQTHCRMVVVDTRIDDSHLGALAQGPLLVQLVHTSHVVDGVVLVDDVAVEKQLRLARSQEELTRRPGLVDNVQSLEQVRVGLRRLNRTSVEDLALEDLEDSAAVIIRDILGGGRGINVLG